MSEEEEEGEGAERRAMAEEQLAKLIHEKQKEVVDSLADSLCSMQAWLYDLKVKRKPQGASSPASDTPHTQSSHSTRPASPRVPRS